MIESFSPSSPNLSTAWSQVLLRLLESGVNAISPLTLTVSDIKDGEVREKMGIRHRLDTELTKRSLRSVHTVANTIFPDNLWDRSTKNSATDLYRRYKDIWSRINRQPLNRRGVYFHRLIAYQPQGVPEPINQLDHIISTYRGGNHRRSALQAAIFDPSYDHTHKRQQGFPCLQQVGFTLLPGEGLAVTGFYPTQYIFERAYGNYLGLCRLGNFMAVQMGLTFQRMICVAGVAKLGDASKSSLRSLAADLHDKV